MIFSIQISFVQIGSSLNMSMNVPWPSVYTNWIVFLNIANFDILEMFGITCLGDITYERKYMASTFMIVGIVVIVFVNYIVKCVQLNKGLKSVSLEQKTMTANHVFDTIDIDGNGTIDPEEYQICLDHISSSGKKRYTKSEIVKKMLEAGATIPNDHYEPLLNRKQFVNAVVAGRLGDQDSVEWIRYMENDKLESKYISVAVQIMLLLHAPHTRRTLYYFNRQDLKGTITRSFLKVDYSMEVNTPRWNVFLIFVLFTFIAYCVALPIYIFVSLYRSRRFSQIYRIDFVLFLNM
jgi:hypothetical protein